MAAITEQQLAQRLREVMDNVSSDPNIQPADARQALANGFASALKDFVVDREVNVPALGLNASNVAVTGTATGKIKA